jgi:hypothetical protein
MANRLWVGRWIGFSVIRSDAVWQWKTIAALTGG